MANIEKGQYTLKTYGHPKEHNTTVFFLDGDVYWMNYRQSIELVKIGETNGDKFILTNRRPVKLFYILRVIGRVMAERVNDKPVIHQSYINDAGYIRSWEEKRKLRFEIGFECEDEWFVKTATNAFFEKDPSK